nr:MAG TPA: hypothetical protein [Caudoviricetes sp.]
MYFLFLTIMNHKYIMTTSKRDTQSQRSLTIRLKTHRPTLKRS